MGNLEDADYKLALLLQRQLEAENTPFGFNTTPQDDFQLARKLQDQFSLEEELAPAARQELTDLKDNRYVNNSKDLIDPTWELVDPTPNIHNLFIVFNQKFFWNKLLSVCVVWSKRMTSCAGICSYQGGNGFCKIALSEPLLKLRPRKDLVETLLHEMIHAFLFVTHNNRDRDAHGPEFHKHMDRINGEAGTKITVYHSFHDEVRLYQQHWWKCNGPCVKNKPYFGMVRRATNRAPGKNDRWFEQHTFTCGGTFIKIKEPEKGDKNEKKSIIETTKKPNFGDIRKYVTTSPGKSSQSNSFLKNVLGNSTTRTHSTNTVNGINKINGFHNINDINNKTSNNSNKTSNKENAKSSGNIIGFKDLKNPGIKSGIKNSSSTIVVTNTNNNNKSFSDTNFTKPINPGNSRTNNEPSTSNEDYNLVRQHWLNKFDNLPPTTSTPKPKKRLSSDNISNNPTKKQKTESPQKNDVAIKEAFPCPVCNKLFKESELNEHLDACLQNSEGTEMCPVCDKTVLKSELEKHVSDCISTSFPDNDEDLEEIELTKCEICTKYFKENEIDGHVQTCFVMDLCDSFNDDNFEADLLKENTNNSANNNSVNSVKDYVNRSLEDFTKIIDNNELTEEFLVNLTVKPCYICSSQISAEIFESHIIECVNRMATGDNIYETDTDKWVEVKGEPSSSNAQDEEKVPCLCCNKSIVKSELNGHLENCLGKTFEEIEDFDDAEINGDDSCNQSDNSDNNYQSTSADISVKKYNCPICVKLIKECDMGTHVDTCLKQY